MFWISLALVLLAAVGYFAMMRQARTALGLLKKAQESQNASKGLLAQAQGLLDEARKLYEPTGSSDA